MSSSYEMSKQEGQPPNPAFYPPNPAGSAVYPPNLSGPPGYSPNISGPPVYAPNQIPTYCNNQPAYCGGQPQPGFIATVQPNVVVVPQPAYKDYMAWSVVNLIFFNLIFGIVAVVFSAKTRDSVRHRDFTSAASNSHIAFSLNITALVLGLITHICWISWLIYYSVTYSKSYSSYYYNYGYYG
ncbi:interferon-induced transmembrane protein 1-like [Mantella aurantiaca]